MHTGVLTSTTTSFHTVLCSGIVITPTFHCFNCTTGRLSLTMYLGCRQTLTSFIIISYVGEAKFLQCKFCPEVEKLFITNGNVSGLRKDLNGVLLLDSILQPPFKGPCMEPVVFELTLSDVSIK